MRATMTLRKKEQACVLVLEHNLRNVAPVRDAVKLFDVVVVHRLRMQQLIVFGTRCVGEGALDELEDLRVIRR